MERRSRSGPATPAPTTRFRRSAQMAPDVQRLTSTGGVKFGSDWQPLDRPPGCSGVRANPDELWPPNGTLLPVELSGASDPDGDAVSLGITGVTQDEPVRDARDAFGAAENAGRLRAKRDPR